MLRRLGIAAVALALVGSVLALRDTGPAAAFGPGDVTPPTLHGAAEVIGPHTPLNDVVLLFDDIIRVDSIPAGADLLDFDVRVDGVRDLVTSAELTHVGMGSPEQMNSFVTIFLTSPAPDDALSVTVSYTPGVNPVRDEAGNPAGPTVDPIEVALLRVGVFEPLASVVDGFYGPDHLGLVFPDPVVGPLPDKVAFTVTRNSDAPVNPSNVSVLPEFGGRIIDLALPISFRSGDAAHVTYTKPAVNPIRNAFGDQASTFTDTSPLMLLQTTDSVTIATSAGGGIASTDTGLLGTTAQDPLATTVTVNASATITISEGNTTTAPTSDLMFLDQSVEIDVSAPPGTFSVSNPILLNFKLDGSVLDAFGANEQTLEILRNGAIVQGCINPDPGSTADPDPCVASRTRIPPSGTPWYAEFVIRTSAASGWTFAVGTFRAPVDAPPVVNTINASRGIPVKFGLGGDLGLDIFAAGYPKSQVVDCDTKAPIDPVETTVTAGASSLSYNPTTQTYTYVWKTDRAWSKTCRQLILKFANSTTRIAIFRFS